MTTTLRLPQELGYRMPAEWERHDATWLTWPRPDGVSYPSSHYEAILPSYLQFIRTLIPAEHVRINVFDEDQRHTIDETLRQFGLSRDRIELFLHPAYEPWCRDHGPIFLVQEGDPSGPPQDPKAIVDWGYNAWGDKYPPYDLDDAVPTRIAEAFGLPLFANTMVLEGGSIDVNGVGDLLTTKSCLLNPNRNPNLTQGEIERQLRNYLGVQNILWLEEGILGDDTDGHIDDITRFTAVRTIVTALPQDPKHPDYPVLAENRRLLQTLRSSGNEPFEIIDMPVPDPIEIEGQPMPASYLNFYIANEAVIMPAFDQPNDEIALSILQDRFPTRRVVPIDSSELIWGLGSFHCLSQQEPSTPAPADY